MMLDYNNIKGYDNLSDTAKRVFKRVHKAHNLAQGNEYKNDYIPISVKDNNDYLEVHFNNGSWLHFTANGEWY